MSFMNIIAQFDALGWAVLLGSILFLAGLLRLLVDNRSFEVFSTPHAGTEDHGTSPRADEGSSHMKDPSPGPPERGDDAARHRRRPGRAA
jgi:hypothetical protein